MNNIQKIHTVAGPAITLSADDIDTDQIIPARFMKELTFENLGQYLFNDVRAQTRAAGDIHPLDHPEKQDTKVLLVTKNFGCGSSREHAPQALKRWGIDAVIGESFGDIFRGNCGSIGLVCIVVTEADNQRLHELSGQESRPEVSIDLNSKTVTCDGFTAPFQLNELTRHNLVNGEWDSLTGIIKFKDAIANVEASMPYSKTLRLEVV